MRTLFRENFLKGGQGSVIRPSSVLFSFAANEKSFTAKRKIVLL